MPIAAGIREHKFSGTYLRAEMHSISPRVICLFVICIPPKQRDLAMARNELLLSSCPNPHCHGEWSLEEVIVAALPLLAFIIQKWVDEMIEEESSMADMEFAAGSRSSSCRRAMISDRSVRYLSMRSQLGRFAGSDLRQRPMTDSIASPAVSCFNIKSHSSR